ARQHAGAGGGVEGSPLDHTLPRVARLVLPVLPNWGSLATTRSLPGQARDGMAALSKTDANLAGTASVEAALARKLYEDMLLIRRFEEKAGQLYGMGLVGGFCHLYIGQE